MPVAGPTPIEVVKGTGTRYHSLLHRTDGVVVELDGGGYNNVGGPIGRVPHDIAHLVVEQRLALPCGLWGVLAAGGIVQNAVFVSGRRPAHAQRRARAITDEAGEQLRQAEVLVRALADVALAGDPADDRAFRAAVGDRWWSATITAEALDGACAELRDAAAHWHELRPEASLRFSWRAPAVTRKA
jgi:hypothetical protein